MFQWKHMDEVESYRKFLVGYDRVLCDWRCWHHWWHCLCIYRWNQTECVFETVSLLYSLPQGWTSRKAPQFRSVQFSSVAQSYPTLCDPMDHTVHGILQARILEWVSFPFSRGSSQPRDWTQVSCIVGGFFTSWGTREAWYKTWQTPIQA